jgi:hypothetical protein
MFETGHASFDALRHILPDLFPPPRNRHVIRIVAMRAGGFVVPHLGCIHQTLPLGGQHEIDHHGRAARQGRPRARFEIIRRVCPHKGHLKMGMRINPAGHHITARGVQNGVALKPRADGNDLAALNQHIRRICQIRRHNGAAFDYCGRHVILPDCPFSFSQISHEGVKPLPNRSPNHPRHLKDGVQQNICPRRSPFWGNFLGLIMRQPTDAGAHDHHRGRDAVDPAGIMARP